MDYIEQGEGGWGPVWRNSTKLPPLAKDTLNAFVLTYLHCVLKNESSNVIYRENTESHWLHLFDFSPLCVFMCVLKLLV